MIQYDRNTMLRLINRDEVLRTIYLDRCRRLGEKFSKEQCDQVLKELFDERIGNDPLNLYAKDWDRQIEKVAHVPPHTWESKEVDKLIYLLTFDGVLKGLFRIAQIKTLEMKNQGLKSTSEDWEKFQKMIAKMIRMHLVT